MEQLLLQLVTMSSTAGVLTLVVLLIRLLFRNAPRWVFVLLWGLVAVRLLCPVVPESAFSLMPSGATPTEMSSTLSEVTERLPLPPTTAAAMQTAPWWTPLAVLWLVGVAVMLLYSVISFARLRLKLCEAVPLDRRVWVCDHIDSPFILGVFRPRIYLPSSLEEGDHATVLSHETAHLQRRDHWWKPLGFLLLSVHWFNPLLWVAYIQLCRDIERACDEKVVKAHTPAQKKAYSETLLRCSVSRRTLAACPIAFGETAVKARVKAVLFYKRPAFWVIVVAVVLCVSVALCFLTDPLSNTDDKAVWSTLLCREYGHDFEGATCTVNGVCRRCEAVGDLAPHPFAAATCLEGEVCTACGATGASALGHEFVGATCTTPAACTRCEATGDLLPHEFAPPTCEAAETCTVCGAVGEKTALGHEFTEATCTADGVCTRCGVIGSYAYGHNYVAGFFEDTCSYCGDIRYVCFHPSKCVGYTCSTCGEYIEGTGNHRYVNWGMGYTTSCLDCGHKEVTDPDGLRAFQAYRDSQGSGTTNGSQTPKQESIRWEVIPNLR